MNKLFFTISGTVSAVLAGYLLCLYNNRNRLVNLDDVILAENEDGTITIGVVIENGVASKEIACKLLNSKYGLNIDIKEFENDMCN